MANKTDKNKTPPKVPTAKIHRRVAARIAAVQILYANYLSGVSLNETIAHLSPDKMHLDEEKLSAADRQFCLRLLAYYSRFSAEIDKELNECIPHFNRTTDKLLQTQLRLSLTELRSSPDIDPPVTISAWAQIIGSFHGDPETSLATGVLNKLKVALPPTQ